MIITEKGLEIDRNGYLWTKDTTIMKFIAHYELQDTNDNNKIGRILLFEDKDGRNHIIFGNHITCSMTEIKRLIVGKDYDLIYSRNYNPNLIIGFELIEN